MKAILLSLVLVFSASTLTSAADDHGDKHLEKGKAAKRAIHGTWKLEFGDGATRLKFIADGRWAITQSDPDTGKVIFHHGGSYTFDGVNYVETVEFANESTAEMIGIKNKFELKIDGDTIDQKGIGNPWNERWVRVNSKAAGKEAKKPKAQAQPK